MTALHVSAQSGHCSLVQYLVEVAVVPLNTQDDGGWTAMVWAAEHRHLDCVRYLLAKGTDPNIRDNVSHLVSYIAKRMGIFNNTIQ